MYEYCARVTRVIDGDTLVATVDLGFRVGLTETFRLLGINTPEIHGVKKDSEEYRKGMKAKVFVEKMLELTDFQVLIATRKDEQGKYGRWLAKIFQPPEINNGVALWPAFTLNEALVKEGLAEEKEY